MTAARAAKFGGVAIAVRELAAPRRFYEEVPGQECCFDFGENIAFASGLSLHQSAHFARLTGLEAALVATPLSAGALYFEPDDIEALARALAAWPGVQIVQSCFEQPWGQRALRCRDPDGHLVEVGAPMQAVVRRFWRAGWSEEEIARRTQLPIAAVRQAIGQASP